jgi:hypothetical protein
MRKTFPNPDVSLSKANIDVAGDNFFLQADGRAGIYLMEASYPAQFGASGHADFFDGVSLMEAATSPQQEELRIFISGF